MKKVGVGVILVVAMGLFAQPSNIKNEGKITDSADSAISRARGDLIWGNASCSKEYNELKDKKEKVEKKKEECVGKDGKGGLKKKYEDAVNREKEAEAAYKECASKHSPQNVPEACAKQKNELDQATKDRQQAEKEYDNCLGDLDKLTGELTGAAKSYEQCAKIAPGGCKFNQGLPYNNSNTDYLFFATFIILTVACAITRLSSILKRFRKSIYTDYS